jgi:hypothetical protein
MRITSANLALHLHMLPSIEKDDHVFMMHSLAKRTSFFCHAPRNNIHPIIHLPTKDQA